MTFTFNAPKSRKWSNFSFLLVWSFQKTLVMFEWFSMSNTMAKSISSIKICSIESIRCTKLKKMTKTLVFGHLDHSKRNVFWFLNDSAWEIRKPNRAYHLVLSKYAMSSQSDDPNWRNWLKISFLAILIVQKGIFPIFEWSRTIDKIAKLCRPFSYIIIYNIESNQWTKLKKVARNLIFGSFLHNLCTLCIPN